MRPPVLQGDAGAHRQLHQRGAQAQGKGRGLPGGAGPALRAVREIHGEAGEAFVHQPGLSGERNVPRVQYSGKS